MGKGKKREPGNEAGAVVLVVLFEQHLPTLASMSFKAGVVSNASSLVVD